MGAKAPTQPNETNMIKDIQEMWNTGLSVAEIGRKLNVTKGVISGIIHRAKKEGVEFTQRTVTRPRPTGMKYDKGKKTVRLPPGGCKFITNDDTRSAIYCGEPISRYSYCEHHASICYIKTEKKK